MSQGDWSLEAEPLDLPLAERFTIATRSWDVAENVLVRLRWEGVTGLGEAAPAGRGGETRDAVIADLEALDLDGLASPFDLEGVLGLLPPGAARCALDIALHDLAARLAGVSLAALLGLEGRPLPPTSLTVPISSVERMVERARGHADHPVLKMKLGFVGDVDAVRAVRAVYDGKIRLDANEGWDVDQAMRRLEELETLDIELCEQPIPAGDRGALAKVTAATSIPIFADEDVATAADVAALTGAVDGVNLKLRKAGGIRETLRAMATGRALGMQVMLGCNLESGIAGTAAAHVAALVDFADLDGPLLLRHDPFPGVSYDRGSMTLPPGPGLGVHA